MTGSPAKLWDAKPVMILGVPISTLSFDETVSALVEMVREKTPRLVVTADATALVIARENPAFSAVLDRATLITADSVGVLWAMRRAGHPEVQKVSGVDLVSALCQKSSETGLRLYFLGSAPGITEAAAEKLRLKYPGCNIVGTHHGYFPADSDAIVGEAIATAKPDVLFVAMGMPRQEEFILATQSIINAPLAMGVGGSFDVFSGNVKRAPLALQKMKLEWLWRLMQNPKKIVKVKELPKFVWMILRNREA